LELKSRNTFQLRQLALKYPNKFGSFYGNVGRFPIVETGNIFVDGVEIGIRSPHFFQNGIFGGLNPKRPDQQYVEFNSTSMNFGMYSVYKPENTNWNKHFYISNAFVSQLVKSKIDRLYLYNNTVWQRKRYTRLISVLYLDFIPRVNIQNLFLSYQTQFLKYFQSQSYISVVDVIEYTRYQGIRERLTPSPYYEIKQAFKFLLNSRLQTMVTSSYGRRQADKRIKVEGTAGVESPRFFSKNLTANANIIGRKNFTSHDIFIKFGTNFYSKFWELGADLYFGREDNYSGIIFHPFIVDLNVAHFITKNIYATLSGQYAQDEIVKIFSGFLKISYRFGTSGVPPLRDGAPLKGRL